MKLQFTSLHQLVQACTEVLNSTSAMNVGLGEEEVTAQCLCHQANRQQQQQQLSINSSGGGNLIEPEYS